jgi:hypothetical protein
MPVHEASFPFISQGNFTEHPLPQRKDGSFAPDFSTVFIYKLWSDSFGLRSEHYNSTKFLERTNVLLLSLPDI